MPRVYSKAGCNRCKTRRKKCDEIQPVCSACAKWGWSCSYDARQPRSRPPPMVALQLTTNDLTVASVYLPELIQQAGDIIENKVLENIPELIKTFFSPTSATRTRDLQVMWQLMLSNNLLRNSCVACFSTIMRHDAAVVEKSHVTYGKALKSLRSSISKQYPDQENIICVIASVVFLGKMESFAPHSLADPLQHWMALVTLLGKDKVSEMFLRRIVPLSVSMLIFESLVYHIGTHAIFSCATEGVWHSWQTQNLYQTLCDLNPDDSGRLGRSPLLCGQYALYITALQTTYLSHYHPEDYVPSKMLDGMQAFVHDKDASLSDSFAVAVSVSTNAAKYKAECAIYRLFCNSLLIFITALREPSQSQRAQMERLVDSGMKMFLDLPSYGDDLHLSEHANHFMLAAIWPIEIQGCATYNLKDFEVFMSHYEILEQFIDAGHQRRARILFDQVRAHLDGSCAEGNACKPSHVGDRPLPVGLKLLRHVIVPPEPDDKLKVTD